MLSNRGSPRATAEHRSVASNRAHVPLMVALGAALVLGVGSIGAYLALRDHEGASTHAMGTAVTESPETPVRDPGVADVAVQPPSDPALANNATVPVTPQETTAPTAAQPSAVAPSTQDLPTASPEQTPGVPSPATKPPEEPPQPAKPSAPTATGPTAADQKRLTKLVREHCKGKYSTAQKMTVKVSAAGKVIVNKSGPLLLNNCVAALSAKGLPPGDYRVVLPEPTPAVDPFE